MTTPSAVAPRFATLIAGAVMAYAAAWGFIRIAIAGFQPVALTSLLLLCAAFLFARRPGGLTRPQAIIVASLALSGLGLALLADGGALAVADIWLTPAVASIALLLLWRQQHIVAWGTMAGQIALLWSIGGFELLEELGVLTTVLTLAVVAAAGRVLGWYAEQMQRYSETERDALEWRIAQDAYQQAHQDRIAHTGALAGEMLRRIVAGDGRLDGPDRAECRLLHQSIRDETRGRLLLNDAVREQVRLHRARGCAVQLLDDGELNRLDSTALAELRDEIAERISPLTSDRIVIRSGTRHSAHIVTIVATTPDPIGAALGLDDDDRVDLWHEIKASSSAKVEAARQ